MALNSSSQSPHGYKPHGYYGLADLANVDKSFAIFRRFDDLNTLNLLSLQAEICEARKEIRHQCQINDILSGDTSGHPYSYDFKSFRKEKPMQYKKLGLLREKLKDYNELLLQVYYLSKLEDPETSQLKNLQNWLGHHFQGKTEARAWEENDPALYLCPSPASRENDHFTRLVRNVVVGIYHQLCGRRVKAGRVVDEEAGFMSYDDKKVDTASYVIATVLASVLPVVTIFVLNIPRDTNLRIGLTVVFTAVFASVLATFSSARRVEIFAATATYAAIEVVFIGSSISSTSDAAAASTNITVSRVM